jgi:hypothetical protein
MDPRGRECSHAMWPVSPSDAAVQKESCPLCRTPFLPAVEGPAAALSDQERLNRDMADFLGPGGFRLSPDFMDTLRSMAPHTARMRDPPSPREEADERAEYSGMYS